MRNPGREFVREIDILFFETSVLWMDQRDGSLPASNNRVNERIKTARKIRFMVAVLTDY
jgi:hypothetical protein